MGTRYIHKHSTCKRTDLHTSADTSFLQTLLFLPAYLLTVFMYTYLHIFFYERGLRESLILSGNIGSHSRAASHLRYLAPEAFRAACVHLSSPVYLASCGYVAGTRCLEKSKYLYNEVSEPQNFAVFCPEPRNLILQGLRR